MTLMRAITIQYNGYGEQPDRPGRVLTGSIENVAVQLAYTLASKRKGMMSDGDILATARDAALRLWGAPIGGVVELTSGVPPRTAVVRATVIETPDGWLAADHPEEQERLRRQRLALELSVTLDVIERLDRQVSHDPDAVWPEDVRRERQALVYEAAALASRLGYPVGPDLSPPADPAGRIPVAIGLPEGRRGWHVTPGPAFAEAIA